MLVAAFEHENALRADLQAHYGIDLDHAMAGAHTPNHIGALVEYLPKDAHIFQKLNKDASWTRQEIILASIQNNLRGLIWGLSPKDKRGPEPKPLGPSWLTESQLKPLPARTMPIDELMAALEAPRSKHGR